ncbi:unnamed protein product [Cylicocyclus nassatus]|uniref:Uncharacterized protein n=1 Tax=Cylicocyclus nassatus TaxID=53992 RepID=A0AA36HD30_CYLNA|nr:unnamed protein product [Cylicocyclus nassatus]
MLRHFVAFSLLLFVLEISDEATVYVPSICSSVTVQDSKCIAHCLEQLNCQNAHCEKVGRFWRWRCVCEDCPDDQQKNLRGEIPGPVPN